MPKEVSQNAKFYIAFLHANQKSGLKMCHLRASNVAANAFVEVIMLYVCLLILLCKLPLFTRSVWSVHVATGGLYEQYTLVWTDTVARPYRNTT